MLKAADLGDDHENAAYVIDALPEQFDDVLLGERHPGRAAPVA